MWYFVCMFVYTPEEAISSHRIIVIDSLWVTMWVLEDELKKDLQKNSQCFQLLSRLSSTLFFIILF